MKPDRIIIVRHGQSVGNVSKTIYRHLPDYALQLTKLGKEQAIEAGQKVAKIVGKSPVMFYCSPFWRTRQTLQGLQKSLKTFAVYEDPRLREQEWGHLRANDNYNEMEENRDKYGHFYFRIKDGESCADVFDRVGDFLHTLHRDFKKPKYPRNVVIVSHGMTLRLILMRWFHLSVEEFEKLANPKNGEIVVLKRGKNNKYQLQTPLRTHELKHTFQFRPEFFDQI